MFWRLVKGIPGFFRFRSDKYFLKVLKTCLFKISNSDYIFFDFQIPYTIILLNIFTYKEFFNSSFLFFIQDKTPNVTFAYYIFY